ncbi:MAG: hypothetical protein WDN28_17190 [Chthoniobacter sp.]
MKSPIRRSLVLSLLTLLGVSAVVAQSLPNGGKIPGAPPGPSPRRPPLPTPAAGSAIPCPT